MATQLGHAAVDGLPESIGIAGVDDGGQDAATGGLDELHGFGEVIGSRGIVGHARRKLAGDVDGDDVGALIRHPHRVRGPDPVPHR
jgi:hypothetical protein